MAKKSIPQVTFQEIKTPFRKAKLTPEILADTKQKILQLVKQIDPENQVVQNLLDSILHNITLLEQNPSNPHFHLTVRDTLRFLPKTV